MLNQCGQISRALSTMEDKNLENGILPDLPDEITEEQLVLQQKVFRKNEEFIKLQNGIIKWLRSDVNNREYPIKYKRNRNAFWKKAEKYMYDENSQKLYKQSEGNDGIGNVQNHFCSFNIEYPRITRDL